MVTEREAFALARKAIEEWEPGATADEMEVRRLPHGWRCEVIRSDPLVVGGSHPGVTEDGRLVRIPDGVPDPVADEILSVASDGKSLRP